MLKTVKPKNKSACPPPWVRGKAYVRFTLKMLYLSSEAARMLGEDVLTISGVIDKRAGVMLIVPGGNLKLCAVTHAKHARRIETNGALTQFIVDGFPVALLGKYLPCERALDGSLAVSLASWKKGESA